MPYIHKTITCNDSNLWLENASYSPHRVAPWVVVADVAALVRFRSHAQVRTMLMHDLDIKHRMVC